MWWVLEVQEATQRKSMRGLDNTTAEGADGFKNILQIIDELERVGEEKGFVQRSLDEASGEQVVFEDSTPHTAKMSKPT